MNYKTRISIVLHIHNYWKSVGSPLHLYHYNLIHIKSECGITSMKTHVLHVMEHISGALL